MRRTFICIFFLSVSLWGCQATGENSVSHLNVWAKGDQWRVRWTARHPVNAALAPDPIVMDAPNKTTSIRTEDILEFEVLKSDTLTTVIALSLHGDIYELHMVHAGDVTYIKKIQRETTTMMLQEGKTPLFTPDLSYGLLFDFPLRGGASKYVFKDLTGRDCEYERTEESGVLIYQMSYQYPAGPKMKTIIKWRKGAKWWQSFRRESVYEDAKGQEIVDILSEGILL
jgi:hypothetical protein